VTRYHSNFMDGEFFNECHGSTETNAELRACLNISPWSTYVAALYWAGPDLSDRSAPLHPLSGNVDCFRTAYQYTMASAATLLVAAQGLT